MLNEGKTTDRFSETLEGMTQGITQLRERKCSWDQIRHPLRGNFEAEGFRSCGLSLLLVPCSQVRDGRAGCIIALAHSPVRTALDVLVLNRKPRKECVWCVCLTHLVRESRKALLTWILTLLTASEMVVVLVACAWSRETRSKVSDATVWRSPLLCLPLSLLLSPLLKSEQEEIKITKHSPGGKAKNEKNTL